MMKAKNFGTRPSDASGCFIAGVLSCFTALSGVAFYVASLRPIADIFAARSWVATQCAIVSSRLVEDPATYRAEIIYTYDYDGRTYQGGRLDFDAGSTTRYDLKVKIVEAHPPGSELDCYVDPDEPTRSVIDRSPGHFLWWGLLPLAFLALGVGGLAFFLIVRGVIPLG